MFSTFYSRLIIKYDNEYNFNLLGHKDNIYSVNDHECKKKKLSDNEFCLETDNNDKDDLKCSDALVAEKILIVSLIQ